MTTAPIENAGDLRARIRSIAVTEPNPAVITEQILRTLTAPEFRVVATVALHNFVGRVLQRGIGEETPIPQVRSYETPTGRTPSARTAAIRDWVARQLLKPICVDPAEKWLHLGDCTAADLAAAAEIRRGRAARTLDEAEHLEGIVKAVEQAGVPTVKDLPRETLEAVLRR